MIAHKRIRVVSGCVEEAPRPFSYSGGFSKAQGWTDIRVIELPPPAIKDARYVYEKGGTVPSIAKNQTGAVLALNASYVEEKSGQLLGRTIAGGKQIAGDIIRKTEKREHLFYRDGRFGIGFVPDGAQWGAQGSPRLRCAGRNVIKEQVTFEKTGADIIQGDDPRMAAGLKSDGALVIVSVDGRGGGDRGLELEELGYVFDWLGCPDAINLDGGGSATLFTNVPELQAALGIKGDTKVCDLSAGGAPRKVHHALVLQVDLNFLFPKKQIPLLIIDPGHGGHDPGGGSNEYFKEKDLVLEISRYQAGRFKQLGVLVALTRKADITLEPTERTKIVRESGAKYCLSNHINAAGNPAARGVETIHSLKTDGKLAHALFRAVVDAGMLARRVFTRQGVNGADYYFMHRETSPVETVIIEYGFASNGEDSKLLSTRWRDYAEAAVRAFCSFIDHPYAPPEEGSTSADKPNELPRAEGRCGVLLDGEHIGSGYIMDGGVSHLPTRLIAEACGLTVGWDGKNVLLTRKENH
jgi:N-acetylmuramoyl-L-alanine amidase